MTQDTPITRQCRFPNCACLDKSECVGIREDEALADEAPAAKPEPVEPVGELLNPNVVRLLAGPVYDPLTDQTYQAGDQMSAEVWLRWAGPLPTATADDAPVGYQLGDSAPVRQGLQRITMQAHDEKDRLTGMVNIYPDGQVYDDTVLLEHPADFKAAVVAVLRELHPVTADHIGKPRDGFEVVMTVPGFATADEARAFQSKLDDTFMGMAEAEGRAATSITRAASVTTRSPSEAHAIAGATQLDEVLSGSTEGISQSILAAAAEAADLEPVSEAGGDDRSVADIRKDMATAFDVLTDYWATDGMPESVEMKLRELLADETPDPTLMKDVLFVIDADGSNARAIITEDGIRLEGGSARSYGLLGEATGILPLILERETNRKLYAAATLADASKAIRYAIESGEDTDAAGELIEDLWNWLNDDPAPIKVKPWSEMSEGERAWAKTMAADVTQPSFFAASGDCPPLTDEERARIKAAIESQIGGLRAVNSQMPQHEPCAKELIEGIRKAKADIEGKDFDHEAGDAYLRERQDQSALDRIRTVSASSTAGIVDRMENRPEDDYNVFTLRGNSALEADKAFRRAVTMGTAMLQVTHNGHADGFEVTLVTPQDSDAPDGVAACDEGGADFSQQERAIAAALTIAKREGAVILEHRGKGVFVAASPVHHKIGYVGEYATEGRGFYAKPRNKPKT